MTARVTIHWFQRDLRLSDNPALLAAAQDAAVVPVYGLIDEWAPIPTGAASRVWLYHSLKQLSDQLGGHLSILTSMGDWDALIRQHSVTAVYWNAVPGIDYQPVHEHLAALGVDCHGYSDTLLWEPGSVVKSDGQPYKVFTPYYRRCIETSPSQPVSIAKPSVVPVGLGDTSALLPTLDWASRITATWQPGERGAATRLAEFLEAIQNYADGREIIQRCTLKTSTSGLMPFLGVITMCIWLRGNTEKPAIRLWMQGCVNYGKPVQCTTEFG
jgi:deoxyribodipyrimidine photo-lyase